VLGLEAAPLLLGFILGPMLEEYFKRQMLISDGDFTTFYTHPISAFMLFIILVIFIFNLYRFFKKISRRYS